MRIRYGLGLGLTVMIWAATAGGSEPVRIDDRRELFVDNFLVEGLQGGACRVMHRPIPREIVMTFDKPWEGNACGYFTIFQDGNIYRMYYRGCSFTIKDDKLIMSTRRACYAESEDGRYWKRPKLGLFEFEGSKENNIVWAGDGCENFTVFKDENPKCAKEVRYKAVGLRVGPGGFAKATKELLGFVSSDGIHWKLLREEGIIKDGWFDSQNVVFWDKNIGAYRAYYRYFKGFPEGRDIKTATSGDFVNWSKGIPLKHIKKPPAQFYTNVIRSYYRADHIYIGMPGMYKEHSWTSTLEQLPDPKRRRIFSSVAMRYGTAITNAMLMWSRDGVSFERSSDTFIRPGPERVGSWNYGDHWAAWHVVETASGMEGAARELSLYVTESYWPSDRNCVQLRRNTLRLDGFASIHCPIEGGEVVTGSLIFEGERLLLNFATSAYGTIKVEIQDKDGIPIPGFALNECVELYGDTVERGVQWKNGTDVSKLAGQVVKLRFVMADANLYSIKFE